MGIRDKAKAAAEAVDEVTGAAFDDVGRLHVYEEVDSPRVQKSVREAVATVSPEIEVRHETKAIGPNPKSKVAKAAKAAAEGVEGVVGTALVFGTLHVYLEINSPTIMHKVREEIRKVTDEFDLRFNVTGPLASDLRAQIAKAAKAVQHVEGVHGADVESELGTVVLVVYLSQDDERTRAHIMTKVWGVAPKAKVKFEVIDPDGTVARLLRAREAILAIDGVIGCRIETDKLHVKLKEDDPRVKDQVFQIVSLFVPGTQVSFEVPPPGKP